MMQIEASFIKLHSIISLSNYKMYSIHFKRIKLLKRVLQSTHAIYMETQLLTQLAFRDMKKTLLNKLSNTEWLSSYFGTGSHMNRPDRLYHLEMKNINRRMMNMMTIRRIFQLLLLKISIRYRVNQSILTCLISTHFLHRYIGLA